MGVYAERVSWDCPGCVSVAREGLGWWRLEMFDLLFCVSHRPLKFTNG